jgi:hypothetical protein
MMEENNYYPLEFNFPLLEMKISSPRNEMAENILLHLAIEEKFKYSPLNLNISFNMHQEDSEISHNNIHYSIPTLYYWESSDYRLLSEMEGRDSFKIYLNKK